MSLRKAVATVTAVAGVVWTLAPLAVGMEAAGGSTERYMLLVLAAPPLFVVGVYAFAREYGDSYPPVGRTALWVLAGAPLCFLPLAADGVLVQYALGGGLGALGIAGVGAAVFEGAALVVAGAAWETRVPSRSMAVWLPLVLPASLLGNHLADEAGTYLTSVGYYLGPLGLAWIGLGYYVWRGRQPDTATRAPA